jgi:hypothetical protein
MEKRQRAPKVGKPGHRVQLGENGLHVFQNLAILELPPGEAHRILAFLPPCVPA